MSYLENVLQLSEVVGGGLEAEATEEEAEEEDVELLRTSLETELCGPSSDACGTDSLRSELSSTTSRSFTITPESALLELPSGLTVEEL